MYDSETTYYLVVDTSCTSLSDLALELRYRTLQCPRSVSDEPAWGILTITRCRFVLPICVHRPVCKRAAPAAAAVAVCLCKRQSERERVASTPYCWRVVWSRNAAHQEAADDARRTRECMVLCAALLASLHRQRSKRYSTSTSTSTSRFSEAGRCRR